MPIYSKIKVFIRNSGIKFGVGKMHCIHKLNYCLNVENCSWLKLYVKGKSFH